MKVKQWMGAPRPPVGRRVLASASLISAIFIQSGAHAQSADYTALSTAAPTPAPTSLGTTVPALPIGTPEYFRKVYRSLLTAPLPALIYSQGGIPAKIPQLEKDANPYGVLGSYQPAGETLTKDHAFFTSLGSNGRSCATCHQPPSGMSVSVRNIRARLLATGGKDPIFAPVDGANCPNLVPANNTSNGLLNGLLGISTSFLASHSLLITKGLFRVALPVPENAEYTLEVVRDPTTCNLDPTYNSVIDPSTGAPTTIVSVFRRPLMAANLDFKTTTSFPGPGGNSGNIMWDGRESTLEQQAIDATMGHAQALVPPTPEQVSEIVAFERGIFSAQLLDYGALSLTANGAKGGPVNLSTITPGQGFGALPFNEYDAWSTAGGLFAAPRKSIARGQDIFNNRTFTISNVSGFNDAVGSNAVPGTCATCHNAKGAGSDLIPSAQRDIGIGGHGVAFGGPATSQDLPLFKLTCPAGSSPFNSLTVTTNDPGKALITGKCADIGSRTVPGLRALASREPYFSDGSAATLRQLVDIYSKRFSIGLSNQEKEDLVNFLSAL